MEYMPKYLVMVTGTSNHNKYYKMTPQGDHFDVEFGRVGASCQRTSYSMSQWEKKYREKIAKGYVDRTELVADLIEKQKPATSDGYREIENRAIAEIVERLQAMAKKAVAENYTISSSKVTMAMVAKAQEQLSKMAAMAAASVEEFNRALIELFGIIPRKMGNVSSYIATKPDDFGKILEREQDLLDVMRGQVYVPSEHPLPSPEAEDKGFTILEEKGLVFEEADDHDILVIKAALGSCADKFVRAWRVKNLATQKKFDAYVKDGSVKTKLLWHGSRNENWWSIVGSGLVLRPTNAVITGKMFGYGIYFATKARKSLGYTSLSGSYWAHGSSSSAFMGLYEVAYGKPYDVYSFDSKFYNLNYEGLQRMCPGANCLHAHEGQMLRNDEIIVYQECQTTIKYLVELK